MAEELVFGHVEEFPLGTVFENRAELSKARVHRPTVAGIAGSVTNGGADSIVLSGGYQDDEDLGDEIIYTGHGGNDPNTGKQTSDQSLDASGNRALASNKNSGLPVRVIRGTAGDPNTSPPSGYRYDGLFRVDDYWIETGISGFKIVRFRLTKFTDEAEHDFQGPEKSDSSTEGGQSTKRKETTTMRIVRDSAKSRLIKKLHKFACQFCCTKLHTPAGDYAEGAHIKPLGKPHNGPDTSDNLLCLCPNCHVLFDSGAIAVSISGELINMEGQMATVKDHQPNPEYLNYHREMCGFES